MGEGGDREGEFTAGERVRRTRTGKEDIDMRGMRTLEEGVEEGGRVCGRGKGMENEDTRERGMANLGRGGREREGLRQGKGSGEDTRERGMENLGRGGEGERFRQGKG